MAGGIGMLCLGGGLVEVTFCKKQLKRLTVSHKSRREVLFLQCLSVELCDHTTGSGIQALEKSDGETRRRNMVRMCGLTEDTGTWLSGRSSTSWCKISSDT